MRATTLVLGCLGLAALSLWTVPAAPSYDPLMWLLWGRELADGTLDTTDGPAFKPLPVAVCALLAPLGSAAPGVWLVLARAGALLAVVLAARLARDLAAEAVPRDSRAPLLAGAAAATGVALTGSLLPLAAGGAVEAAFTCLAIRDQVAPPTVNLDNPSIETPIDLVPHKAKPMTINAAMSNSFGFGGTNATLVFERLEAA